MKLYTATLDSWKLAILDITDSLSHSLVQHEYLNTDGADIQSVGAKARTIRFKAYFFGEDYSLEQVQLVGGHTVNSGEVWTGGLPSSVGADEMDSSLYPNPTYISHFDFINFLSTNMQGTSHKLCHPKYGLVRGYVSSYSVMHDDTQDYCTVDIDFIEDEIRNRKILPSTGDISVTADIVTGINGTLASSADSIKAAGNASVLGISVNGAISLTNQIGKYLSTATRTFITEVDKNISAMNGICRNIEDVADTVENTVKYTSDIPSALIGSMNRACNRIFASLGSVTLFPVKFWNSALSALHGANDSLTGTYKSFFSQQFMSVSSLALVGKAVEIMSSDREGPKIFKLQTFDINGNRIAVPASVPPVLSSNDIESMLYQLQIYVQSSLVLNREQPSLRLATARFVNWANYTKLSRLTVKTLTVGNMPLHMLLCRLGQNYGMADVVMGLNPKIRNPAFVEGEVKVYVGS